MVPALLACGLADAADNRITDIRTGGTSSLARLVVETTAETPFSLLLLSDPYRLVIDMPETLWRSDGRPREGALQTSPLEGYRYGNPSPGRSRLVIDLDGPAIPVDAYRLPPTATGHRLVVDLEASGPTAFQLAARALKQQGGRPLDLGPPPASASRGLTMLMPEPRPGPPAAGRAQAGALLPLPRPPQAAGISPSGTLLPLPRPSPSAKTLLAKILPAKPPPATPARKGKWIVFIDAGHGGKDPGAIGVSGTKEKDITLKAARELVRQLEATGRIKALLSRDGDHFHRLRKRITLAREARADVFISLHADAAPNRKARGVSIFTLSDRASDKEAAHLARQENKADLIGGPDLDATDPVVTSALLGMFQRESMNQSAVLAAELISEFRGIPTAQRGHRFAGFAVLKSPDVPSVLVEMGFLTNREDERRLRTESYRRDLMARIARGVLRYLVESGTPPQA